MLALRRGTGNRRARSPHLSCRTTRSPTDLDLVTAWLSSDLLSIIGDYIKCPELDIPLPFLHLLPSPQQSHTLPPPPNSAVAFALLWFFCGGSLDFLVFFLVLLVISWVSYLVRLFPFSCFWLYNSVLRMAFFTDYKNLNEYSL
jgi:hypothetical protein